MASRGARSRGAHAARGTCRREVAPPRELAPLGELAAWRSRHRESSLPWELAAGRGKALHAAETRAGGSIRVARVGGAGGLWREGSGNSQ